MVAMVAVQDNPLAGLPIIRPETHGRHSLSERAGLKFRDQLRRQRELGAKLTADFALDGHLRMSPAEVLAWHYDPTLWRRPVQSPPSGVWRTWFLLGGRGAGKTYAGSIAVIEEAQADPEARILIVGPTDSEIRKTQLEGPSGILSLAPPWFRPVHRRSKRTLDFPNGAKAFYVPAQNPDKLRGYNVSVVWADEIVAWKKSPEEVYRECRRVARIQTSRMRAQGLPARLIITTTPNPNPLFREILSDRDGLVLACSSTFDNAANLDGKYIAYARRLQNTTIGRREFHGELLFLEDACLYGKVDWNASRVESVEAIAPREGKPLFDKLVVSVDPATGEKKDSDLHGIVVEGIREEADGLLHTYVLQDASLRSPEPTTWAQAAVDALHRWEHLAPKRKAFIFAETNTGGSLVKNVIRSVDGKVKVKGMRAMQSKAERAAPVSAMAEARLVHMVGKHHRLEEQLAKFTGQDGGHGRDDRADAFAWPIYLYVCPKRQNAGVAGRPAEAQEDEDDE
ncbi:putative large terminase [Cystobacter fuscus DSM 2262]|uniref:Large terminase n=1 Tax=Cystobacter fuscus (strain ATCC 25194 / DSM 2262 / NBRC 100088 / M29) TaxID=1242864 RepID=S9R0V4_CYSF2|nr:terminase family protein [Cystobacter fuscus]EPX62538.1 putative large terminase [Cystobacter fuscus DSM 2262]